MFGLFLIKGLVPPLLFTLFPIPAAPADGSHKATEPFQPPGYEIGSVGCDDCVLGKFILHNIGERELVLRSVRRNCACYKVFHTANRLQPGESITFNFELTFPKGKRLGNAIFYILSNDRQKPLRLFIVKLKQSDDPDFAAAKPNQIILQLLDDDLPETDFLGRLNWKHRVTGIQERSTPGGKQQYVLQFPEGTDIPQVAKAYVEHPSVGLVLFRASDKEHAIGENVEPSARLTPAKIAESEAPKKAAKPLAIHWFYSEGCAFCDEVKSLLREIFRQRGKRVLGSVLF